MLSVRLCVLALVLAVAPAWASPLNIVEPFEDETQWRSTTVSGWSQKCVMQNTTAVAGNAAQCAPTSGGSNNKASEYAVNHPDGVTKGGYEFTTLGCCFDHRHTVATFGNSILDVLNGDGSTALWRIAHQGWLVNGLQITNNNGASTYTGTVSPYVDSNIWYKVCFMLNSTDDDADIWINTDPDDTPTKNVSITSGFADDFGEVRVRSHYSGAFNGTGYFDNLICTSYSSEMHDIYLSTAAQILPDGDQYSYNTGTDLIQDNDGSCNGVCDDTVGDYWKCIDSVNCTEPEDEAHSWHLSETADQVYSSYANTSGLAGATIYGVGLYGYLQGEGGTESRTQWGVSSNCDSGGYGDMKNSATIVEENNVWNQYFYFSEQDEDSNDWDAEGLDCLNAGIARLLNSTNNIEVDVMSLVYVYNPDGGGAQPIFMSSLVDWLVSLMDEGEGVN